MSKVDLTEGVVGGAGGNVCDDVGVSFYNNVNVGSVKEINNCTIEQSGRDDTNIEIVNRERVNVFTID